MMRLSISILLIALLPCSLSMAVPLDNFLKTGNAAISGHNTERLTNVTVEACATACLAPSRLPWCVSFDYYKHAQKCDLSDKMAADVGGLKTNYAGNPYDHYAVQSTELTKFIRIPNAAISGHNDEHLTNVTESQCAAACTDSSRPWCVSFDYYKNSQACDLSDKRADDVGGLKTDYSGNPYDHYSARNFLANIEHAVVLLENKETKRYLFSTGNSYTASNRGNEGGWLTSPGVVGTDANYYNRAYWQMVGVPGRENTYFLVNKVTNRLLLSAGSIFNGTRGGEGGWLNSPDVLGADANYYNRAYWRMVPTGDSEGTYLLINATNRLLLSAGSIFNGARGDEEGWLNSPNVLGADANYYERAKWKITSAPIGSYPVSRIENLGIPENQISSVKIRGAILQAYDKVNFSGTTTTFLESQSNLSSFGMDNLISSYRIIPTAPDWEVVFYEASNYSGNLYPANESIAQVKNIGIPNDSISSIALDGAHVKIYEHPNFDGNFHLLTESHTNLASLNLNDQISSYRIIPTREDWQVDFHQDINHEGVPHRRLQQSPASFSRLKTTWIGTAPFCEASSSNCTGETPYHISSDSWGNGSQCFSGTKVLCSNYPPEAFEFQTLGTAPFCAAGATDCVDKGGVVTGWYDHNAHTCITGYHVSCAIPKVQKVETNRISIEEITSKSGKPGFFAKVDLTKSTIVVPNSPTFVSREGGQNCDQLGQKGTDGYTYISPLYSIENWHQQLLQQKGKYVRLMVNANWFDVSKFATSLHESPCSNINGFSASDGVTVSKYDRLDKKTQGLDAILFFEDPSRAKIIPYGELPDYMGSWWTGNNHTCSACKHAVGGFIIVKNGRVVPESKVPSSNSPKSGGKARTAVGVSQDGKTLYILTVQPGAGKGGVSYKEVAAFLIDRGAHNVLNLDNSGSSQFYFDDLNVKYLTLPGDSEGHRPVPNFLAVE